MRTRQADKVTEKDIRGTIRDFLRTTGWFVVIHYQGPLSHRGFADLTAVKNGKTIYVEVKKQRGVQSEEQKQFQRDIENHGAEYILARCVEDVARLEPGARLF